MSIQIFSVHRNIFVDEVLVQVNLALGAQVELRRLVANPATGRRRGCWAHIQSLLAHAAVISKFMRPATKSEFSHARATMLKTALGVKKESIIFRKSAKNHVEHLNNGIDN